MHPYRHIVLASRPKGTPTAENFRLETGSIPIAADGQVLVRSQYLSLDPYMRGRMNDAQSYPAPISIGGVMEGEARARGLESKHPDYRPGGLVQRRVAW